MITVADLLSLLEERKIKNIEQLAREVDIPIENLHLILTDLNQHNLVEYNTKTGDVALSKWLQKISRRIERSKPASGEIILPRYGEIQIQDVVIGNYTSRDLELKVRLRARFKEIAICDLT